MWKKSLLIMGLCVVSNQSKNILEYVFEEMSGVNSNNTAQNEPKSIEEIVRNFGYRLDTHLVASETGHILTLHRIPKGRKKSNHTKINKEVAFIHHGFMGSSDMWLLRGPTLDLPYLLADSGYDVWLFNNRGNTHSRKHKFLDPDRDPHYWNFGVEEIGYYDLPITIDYILNITKQKNLFFIGHSLGSSAGFITCSMKPEYNEKIKLFLALAPLANVKHKLDPFHKTMFVTVSSLMPYMKSLQMFELFPRRAPISKIMEMLCQNGSPLLEQCFLMIFAFVGNDRSQIDTNFFPTFLKYYPAGSSLKIAFDTIQYYLTGNFSHSEEGANINLLKYSNSSPPLYDLSKITAPVSLHYGRGDLLVTEEDIDDLSRKLPKVIGKFKIPHKQFNHLDFVLASNARSVLYETLLAVMSKYK